MDMQSYISHFVIINLYLKPLSQNCFQRLCHFKFTVKQYLDILCQWIADLFIPADSVNCKRNMICQRKKDSPVYGISEGFLRFCENLVCNFQIFRIDSLYQFFR